MKYLYLIAEKILRIMKLSKKIKINPSPVGSVKRRCPDISYLLKIVGDFEFTDLDHGLHEVIKFIKGDSI